MIQPPKCRPSYDDVRCPASTEPLEFSDCGVIVRRRAPVDAVPLKKGNRSSTFNKLLSPFTIVDKDETFSGRNHIHDLFSREEKPMCPRILFPLCWIDCYPRCIAESLKRGAL